MATAREQLAQFAAGSKALGRLCREYKNRSATVHLEELVGGALSFYAAAAVAESGGVHVFVAEDRDAAAYLLNDFYNLLDERQVYFFPSSWKRSAAYGAEDAQGVVQRTATMHAVRNFTGKGYLVVCTCPEALAERVADAEALQRETITVRVGDRISIEVLEQALVDASFTRVDFVYEPGQYSVRGGIVDVFSYSESKPYRLDFFGDEVDSIRRFNISSQLSSDRLERVEIIPDLNAGTPAAAKVSFARFAGAEASWWFYDADFVLRRVNDIRRRTLSDMEHPDEIDSLLTSRNSLVADLSGSRIFLLRDNLPERPAAATVKFATSPQPKFNKNFEMLADDMIRGALRGYDTYILSENKAQVERLENIFHQIGRGQAVVRSLSTTLHEGFVDNDLKLCLYTDHQIFDRYQRYRINGEIRRDEQMTVAELNQLRPGDYVVHIDHGVGRFDGLVKIAAGDGRMQEAIKLVYKDGDVLFVNVHSLHRISRYKSGDGEPPKVYKLGNGAWQKLKNATKKAVKDISRELIALYAKRKASKGYAFSHDSYLQHELEASFRWEDTPDQQSATAAIKKDMESDQPMDRLVCGDVGFGKTEVAIRAAFKAAVDGKQVAVLVPTTILALQHYRSFTERLRDFPVRVEYINRTKSTKEVSQIREDLASGKIDILIGTHKMLGKQIVFRDLGLLIIDEEQKFGVAAKEKLTEMSVSVDTLTLTATPIPRTLQFSLMGSRDLSVISTPPPNRQPILTESHVFSEEIIRDARSRVSTESASMEATIEKLEQVRQRMERDRAEAARQLREAEENRRKSERLKAELSVRLEKADEKARRDAERIIGDARRTADEVMRELDALRKMEKTDADHHRANDARAALRRKLNVAEDAAAAAAHPQVQEKKVSARPVRVGDTVQLRKMGDIKATVTAISADRTLSLRAGIMNVTAKEQDVYLLENEKPEAQKFAAAHAASLRNVAAESEIDLRGMDTMEAVAATERFLDNAVMAKLEKVTIIHGKGTGALRAAVQQSLRKNKAVKSYRLGRYGEGESGVTVVELK